LQAIDGHGHMLRSDAAEAFKRAQQESGGRLHVISAYRSAQRQAELYAMYHGKRPVARPGHSEHQSGIALDLHGYNSRASRNALAHNGFVQHVDGDPNHWTYVGHR
jgi:LAS superfamily LD-carboxypeptidase LdcB